MHTSTILQAVATASMATSAVAHMIMANPVPFSADLIQNGPIDRAQFPCQAQLGFNITKENVMKVGEKQTLSFKGTAVHGGGSCQLVVTTDRPPTANSKFKVIKSIEGGCPGVDGGPSTFDFTLPAAVPDGELSFAWTWFAKLSGKPEMYMNCAPITVSGGAKDASGLDSLPDMFVANLDDAGCRTEGNKDTAFPNPGKEVQRASAFNEGKLEGPCKANSGPPAAAPPAQATPTSAAGGNANNGQYTAEAPVASAPPSNDGGAVFAPSAAPSAEAPVPADPISTPTTLVTVTNAAPAPTAPVQATPPAIPTPAPTPGSASPPANGTACTTDGALVCNGSEQWGLCNHGAVQWQPVAAGTTCANGAIQAKKMRRAGVSAGRAHQRRFHAISHSH
ncbi:hypothetical protein EJ05DRAFT_500993 [Pseudovirgaria hyperparasitica]|uniref:Lytic polysaccharide monooxygenase n=1 Tax=Pseudovirgaria hyperparasitica TaxID=470096 RepID=A0A6A6W6C5_9PEZI|nr:uncharacterized protein EJ05DRAFT_500993 [Pseudovirgaria hyperparasitica]KAF2757456.1 hypothetical protein EJ05DRAFT_500993 [Pseudovirgaria hyperparasitica]